MARKKGRVDDGSSARLRMYEVFGGVLKSAVQRCGKWERLSAWSESQVQSPRVARRRGRISHEAKQTYFR